MTDEQTTGGAGIDVVIRAARAGKGCALDAERTAQVEATYQGLLSRIRDGEQAARYGEVEREAMKARAAALADAARALVVGLGFLPDDQCAEVKDEVHRLMAEVDGIAPDAREFIVVRRETLREMERATRDAIAAVSIGQRPGREPMWGVFEQLGHNKYPGKITIETLAGSESYRIDVPDGDGWVTHYVGGGTMYGIHPCSEQVVRHLAAQWGPPEPAHPWELKGLGGDAEDARPAIGQASGTSADGTYADEGPF